MKLSDSIISEAKPSPKPFKLFDAKGLFLLVSPNGSKYWRLKYRFGGKEKQLSLGTYPDVSLNTAREQCDLARAMLADESDPGEHTKQERAAKRDEQARQMAAMRFMVDSHGALSFRLGNRRLTLSPDETAELRTFLDETRSVGMRG